MLKFIGFLASLTVLAAPLGGRAAEEAIPGELETVIVQQSEVETLLGQIVTPGVPEEIAQRAFADLVTIGASATPELIAIYEDLAETDHRRWICARALGHMGGRAGTEALLAGLRSQQFMTRIAAVSALGVLKGDDARLALEEALFDPSMEVRCTAADGLSGMGHHASTIPLARSLNSPDSFHRGRSLPV